MQRRDRQLKAMVREGLGPWPHLCSLTVVASSHLDRAETSLQVLTLIAAAHCMSPDHPANKATMARGQDSRAAWLSH
jgi:hypothetical protein